MRGLGLSGVTRGDEFLRLCENLHLQTNRETTTTQARRETFTVAQIFNLLRSSTST